MWVTALELGVSSIFPFLIWKVDLAFSTYRSIFRAELLLATNLMPKLFRCDSGTLSTCRFLLYGWYPIHMLLPLVWLMLPRSLVHRRLVLNAMT